MAQGQIPYCGAAPAPDQWLTRWNGDPVLLAALALIAVWAWRRRDVSAGFWAGFAGLVLLFVSPLCPLSSALFSVRVVHHVALTAIVAPLIVHGLASLRVPGGAPLWAAIHIILFWLWHAPAPYGAALANDLLFWIMQLSLLASAIAFWAALRRAPPPLAIGVLLGMMVQMGLLGALLTFAGTPFYAPHQATTLPWGLTPLEDQQLGGLIMWAPASAFYLAAAILAGWRILPRPERSPA